MLDELISDRSFKWPHIRSAMLDDATFGRPSRNDDIACDFFTKCGRPIVFQHFRSWKMAGTFALQHLPCLLEKWRGKPRIALYYCYPVRSRGFGMPQNQQNDTCPQQRLRTAWAFWKWRDNLDLNIYLVHGKKRRENQGSPLSGLLCKGFEELMRRHWGATEE